MKTEEIIEMARQAGLCRWLKPPVDVKERFEAFAKLVEEAAFKRWAAQTIRAVQEGVKQEREACAKVCEAGINNATDWDSSAWDQACENRSYAIRARGEA